MTFRQRSASLSSSDRAIFRAELLGLGWVRGTIFGRDVDPEVCSTSATSLARPGWTSSAGRAAGDPERSKTPAGCANCGSFFFQAEDGIRDWSVTGVQTCALPI